MLVPLLLEEVKNLDGEIEDHARSLQAANKNIELLNDKFLNLKKTVRKIAERLQFVESDHQVLKTTRLGTIFGASFLTGRFLTCQQVMRETIRFWNKKQVCELFLDYLNYTLPCGSSCPVSLATPKKCVTSASMSKLYLEFTVPMVNSSWQVIEADPFNFGQIMNQTVCKLSYTGPKRMLIEKNSHCVHSARSDRDDLVLIPTTDCESLICEKIFDNLSIYSISNCKPLKYDNVNDWIQIKTSYDQFHVYCAGSNITIKILQIIVQLSHLYYH